MFTEHFGNLTIVCKVGIFRIRDLNPFSYHAHFPSPFRAVSLAVVSEPGLKRAAPPRGAIPAVPPDRLPEATGDYRLFSRANTAKSMIHRNKFEAASSD